MRAGRLACTFAAAGALGTGCLPYTVGSTARPAPKGTLERTATVYSIPGAVELDFDSTSMPLVGVDLELRYGINEYSDVGLRFPSASGMVVNYKRRLNGRSAADGAALAVMAGGGFVNLGEHAQFELTFLASGQDKETLTPYGGLRSMYVVPLTRYAVSDRPTLGGFLGVRLGTTDLGISPEVGVYYDPSALELRERRWIFVPAVSVHGSTLLRGIGRHAPTRAVSLWSRSVGASPPDAPDRCAGTGSSPTIPCSSHACSPFSTCIATLYSALSFGP